MNSYLSPGIKILLASIALVVVLGGGLMWISSQSFTPDQEKPIVVYCAEAMRLPMEEIKKQYEKETKQPVELRYGASQTILTQMETGKDGELFFPADDSYLVDARARGLIREVLPVAKMSTVVVVAPDYPKEIKTWSDFLGVGEKIGLVNPKAGAIGKVVKRELERANLWNDLEAKKPTFLGKISDVGSAVQLGTCQAGIMWDTVALQFPKLKIVKLPELDAINGQIQLAVTKFTTQPAHALHFARYVAGKNKGLEIFAKHRYQIADQADEFTDVPSLRLFGGSMLRPALEETVKEFAKREGIQIDTKWNGCGILVGEMKALDPEKGDTYPDLYIACEPRFLKMVQASFGPSETISSNGLVVAIRKDSDIEIKKTQDLAKSGVKLGVGHENQCALGTLTNEALQFSKLHKKIYDNVVKRAASGDQLVLDLRAKALDVVVCYESNVRPFSNEIEYFSIKKVLDSIPPECEFPDQPVAVSKSSRYPLLTQRLLQAIKTPESQRRFEELGFKWKVSGNR